ncbi:MAG: cellulase family glycosylhydrolase [Deltaproteobacteria bacterium]|nr:cellulase family glycosylhydrolase [Deltaproteobacteria bacterium]
MDFLKTSGSEFFINNRPAQLKGAGLGNWLNLEHFMFGLPGTDSQIREAVINRFGIERSNLFWDKFYSVYVGEQDISYLKTLGMNHVRIAVNHKLFFTDGFEKSVAIREIDRILQYLNKYDIYGIIDIHTAPGGQNPDWHSDNYSGVDNFWNDREAMKVLEELWGEIAEYYKNEPCIGGYDLINEPCFFESAYNKNMVDFFKRCTQKIRAVDSNHIIFYPGNTYSRDFSMFNENLDDNSSYTFHLYPFLQIPDDINSPQLPGRLVECLQKDVTYEHLVKKLKKPLWCGETGHPQHMSETSFSVHEFISVLESKKIGWALWPLKDRGAMGIISAKKDGEWNSLCNELSENWVFFDIFTKDSMLSANKMNDKYDYYKWLANESTSAFNVVRKNLEKISFDRFYNALDDYKFEHCIKNESILPSSCRIIGIE